MTKPTAAHTTAGHGPLFDLSAENSTVPGQTIQYPAAMSLGQAKEVLAQTQTRLGLVAHAQTLIPLELFGEDAPQARYVGFLLYVEQRATQWEHNAAESHPPQPARPPVHDDQRVEIQEALRTMAQNCRFDRYPQPSPLNLERDTRSLITFENADTAKEFLAKEYNRHCAESPKPTATHLSAAGVSDQNCKALADEIGSAALSHRLSMKAAYGGEVDWREHEQFSKDLARAARLIIIDRAYETTGSRFRRALDGLAGPDPRRGFLSQQERAEFVNYALVQANLQPCSLGHLTPQGRNLLAQQIQKLAADDPFGEKWAVYVKGCDGKKSPLYGETLAQVLTKIIQEFEFVANRSSSGIPGPRKIFL